MIETPFQKKQTKSQDLYHLRPTCLSVLLDRYLITAGMHNLMTGNDHNLYGRTVKE